MLTITPRDMLVPFSPDDLAEMHSAALRVLREIGMVVGNQQALKALADAGVRVEGGRAFFAPGFVEERLASIRAGRRERRPRRVRERLTIGIGDMCQYYLSPATGEIELMTTADLVEACKCAQSLHDLGLRANVPGVPRDVPQQLQAIVEYRVGAEFLSTGGNVDTLHPPEALPYLFAMAEAMDRPLTGCGMFTVSPLRLAGLEFDAAVYYASHWQSFSVHSLPAVGATAPIHLRAAWVLSIAEAVGGAVVLHVVGGGKPVHFTAGMYPFDLRTLAIIGGSPEFAWMCWAGAQVNRFYDPDAGYSMMLGTQAKQPGLQAGLEKAMAGAFGVMTGCDDLHYAGVLSYDDIFSPEQMLADCELRDALEQLRRVCPPEDADGWLEEIREGATNGYVQTDATLDNHHSTYWYPRLLDRTTWHTYQAGQGKEARRRAREEMLALLAAYSYEPPGSAIEAVRRIFAEAWRALGGESDAPTLKLLGSDR